MLATDGFVLTEKFVSYNARLAPVILSGDFPKAAAYFFPDGISVAAGDCVRNPEYARTLQRIANEGIDALYRGDVQGTSLRGWPCRRWRNTVGGGPRKLCASCPATVCVIFHRFHPLAAPRLCREGGGDDFRLERPVRRPATRSLTRSACPSTATAGIRRS